MDIVNVKCILIFTYLYHTELQKYTFRSLTIKSSLLVSLSFEDIIKSFANQKARLQLLKLK